uniref:Protein SERAC1 n=1 Tax=Gongylonema pulchrum TaxID=637853 RepID=A0A183EC79_9BILA
LIDQGILTLLMQLFLYYRENNDSICLNTLKILANIAMQGEYCAAALAHSEWLPLLASMVASDSFEETLMAEKICNNGLSVFDSTRRRLKTDVYELYHSDEEPIADLVLMHGIRGSAWLPQDIQFPIRIVAIDYASSLVRFRGVNETLSARAQKFTAQLKAAGVGGLLVKRILLDDAALLRSTIGILFMATPHRGSPYAIYAPLGLRPSDDVKLLHQQSEVNRQVRLPSNFLIFTHLIATTGHPLSAKKLAGGLLVKRILLDDAALLRSTIGILFMATPHRGSPYAIYAPLGLRPSDDVKLLHQQSEVNRQLHKDFLGIVDSIPVLKSIAETQKAPLIMRQKGVLVPPESAFLERGAFYHISDIHHNICKPSSREHPVYGIVLQFINDAVHYIMKKGNERNN